VVCDSTPVQTTALTARSWLIASEILLLAATLVLVAGLLGELPESRTWKSRNKVAKVAVVLGVVGELFGDAGIFETSARLQTLEGIAIGTANEQAGKAFKAAEQLRSENLQLEAQIAPRNLTPEDMHRIADVLRSFSGRQLTIKPYVSDAEGFRLGMLINRALAPTGIISSPGLLYPVPDQL